MVQHGESSVGFSTYYHTSAGHRRPLTLANFRCSVLSCGYILMLYLLIFQVRASVSILMFFILILQKLLWSKNPIFGRA